MILLRHLLENFDKAFTGIAISGNPVLTVASNTRVYKGTSRSGAPLYTINKNKLFKGTSVSGAPVATLVGDLMFKGQDVSGYPIARLVGQHTFKGASTSGTPIVTVPSRNILTLFAATYHTLFG